MVAARVDRSSNRSATARRSIDRAGRFTRDGRPMVAVAARRELARAMARAGRESVTARWSVDSMVRGYEDLLSGLYSAKCGRAGSPKVASDGTSRKPQLGLR